MGHRLAARIAAEPTMLYTKPRDMVRQTGTETDRDRDRQGQRQIDRVDRVQSMTLSA